MIFSYRKPDGEVVDRDFRIGKAPACIMVDGVTATRYYGKRSAAVPATSGWPLTCVASGVHPGQADELRQCLKDAGVPTEVTRGGDPIYTNAAHRRKALRARGMFDKMSYG